MRKAVSPVFAVVVIVVALVMGGLYFMLRYRANEAEWAREAAALQRQADMARRSGRAAARRTRRGSSEPGGARRGEGEAARAIGGQPAPGAESSGE